MYSADMLSEGSGTIKNPTIHNRGTAIKSRQSGMVNGLGYSKSILGPLTGSQILIREGKLFSGIV